MRKNKPPTIVSKKVIREKSAGCIVFYDGDNERKFLVLHYPQWGDLTPNDKRESGHFDFPKGHLEKGETELYAAQREAREETGLMNLEFLPGFRESIRYMFTFEKNLHLKEVVFFIARSPTEQVTISHEHLGYEWLPYKEALAKVTFANAKNILKRAKKFLDHHANS